MAYSPPPPTELEASLAAYELALARQARRVELAVEVLQAPGARTEWEIIAASNTLLTYGDTIEVMRANETLRAAMRRLREAAKQAEPARSWREIFSIEAFLYALIILGGFYIFCGLAAAIIKTQLSLP